MFRKLLFVLLTLSLVLAACGPTEPAQTSAPLTAEEIGAIAAEAAAEAVAAQPAPEAGLSAEEVAAIVAEALAADEETAGETKGGEVVDPDAWCDVENGVIRTVASSGLSSVHLLPSYENEFSPIFQQIVDNDGDPVFGGPGNNLMKVAAIDPVGRISKFLDSEGNTPFEGSEGMVFWGFGGGTQVCVTTWYDTVGAADSVYLLWGYKLPDAAMEDMANRYAGNPDLYPAPGEFDQVHMLGDNVETRTIKYHLFVNADDLVILPSTQDTSPILPFP